MDTNILYAGLYSATGASHEILRMIDAGSIVPLLSTTLLFEYEDVLRRNQDVLKLSNRAIEDILNAICSVGRCCKIHFLWRPQLSDPKDDHVLELAIASNHADIVTHNLKDFARVSKFGIRIFTPAMMLKNLKTPRKGKPD